MRWTACCGSHRRAAEPILDLNDHRRPCPAATTGRTPPPPIAATPAAGVPRRRSSPACETFPGLAHRQELVADRRRRPLRQRQQGDQRRRRGQGAGLLRPDLLDRRRPAPRKAGSTASSRSIPRVRHAFLIGQARNEFASSLTRTACPITLCGTLETAVAAASADARAEPQAGRDRAAVARLRLVGPVHELRSSAATTSATLVAAALGTEGKPRHDRFRARPTVRSSAGGGGRSTAGRWRVWRADGSSASSWCWRRARPSPSAHRARQLPLRPAHYPDAAAGLRC